MSTTVSYKGATIATVSNDTKTLLTEGKYLEDDITLVDVSGGGAVLGTKNITANGTYEAEDDSLDGYSEVTVAVPASAGDSGTKNITANGNNQDVVGYAAVNVNVPNSYSAGDEGKVVSNGALVAQTAHADVTPTTSDQTIDTTTNNSLKVKGDANLLASNIKKDVTIFGTTGSYEGGGGDALINSIIERSATGAINLSATKLGANALRKCTAVTTVVFPECTQVDAEALKEMSALTVADLELSASIADMTFQSDSNLTTIILRKTNGVCALQNVRAFLYTRFANGGAGGDIYIPKTLYDALGTGTNDYKAASNWSTVDGYGTITWHAIEGSTYETHYADGTVIS